MITLREFMDVYGEDSVYIYRTDKTGEVELHHYDSPLMDGCDNWNVTSIEVNSNDICKVCRLRIEES